MSDISKCYYTLENLLHSNPQSPHTRTPQSPPPQSPPQQSPSPQSPPPPYPTAIPTMVTTATRRKMKADSRIRLMFAVSWNLPSFSSL